MKSIKFSAQFKSVTEALEKSEIDISYNPEQARETARYFPNGGGHYQFLKCYLSDDKLAIYTLIACRDGLRILSKLSFFSSCMDDRNFEIWEIDENESGATFTDVSLPKTKEVRERISKQQEKFPRIVVASI